MEKILKETIPFLDNDLLTEIKAVAIEKTFEASTPILNDGSFVKVIPIVKKGRVKVFRETDEKELLLYYIEPAQSCFMSVSACIMNKKSRVKAITETETELILIPEKNVTEWMNKYPQWLNFVMQLSNLRFEELLETIDKVAFEKLDIRLITYLKSTAIKVKSPILNVTHRQIAKELGSAREVISRLLKQLEKKGEVTLSRGAINISKLM